jgi:rod shape-determining protein MreC
MAVITVQGIVGKVLKVFRSSAQVLLIDDQSSGVGALLEKTRLQGIVRGTPAGEVVLEKIMSDEAVQPGEQVSTSGGDRIFPKGLPIGVVTRVTNGPDLFLNIRVRPSANLSKLEEVLVVTQVVDKEPTPSEATSVRAVDILAQRLPSVPDKPAEDPKKPKTPQGSTAPPAVATTANPSSAKPLTAKPTPDAAKTGTVPAVTPAVTPKTGATSQSAVKTGSAAGAPKTPSQPAAAPSQTPGDANSAAAKPKPAKPAPDQSQPPPPQDQSQ